MKKYVHTLRQASVLVVALVLSLGFLPATALAQPKDPPGSEPDKVFILLQGINTSLTQADINNGVTPGFEDVKTAISDVVPDAEFITYSYTGPSGKKKPEPRPYTCIPTLSSPLGIDILVLDRQIQALMAKRPTAEFYLVGHSLGGVIAYGYLAALMDAEVSEQVAPLPDNNLKGVITLDAPIGGVAPDGQFFGAIVTFFELLCPGYDNQLSSALLDLATIFNTAPEGNSHGGDASILAVHFSGTQPDPVANEDVADEAADAGIGSLTIGNWNDLLWDPGVCGFEVDGGQFESTQWLLDRAGFDVPIYGRNFTSGGNDCFLDGVLGGANHFDVLTNPSVLEAIQQFITGQVPDALEPAFGES